MFHRGLVQDHDVPLLRLVPQGPHQQELSVLEGIGHGLPIHPGEAAEEGEHDHQAHQGGGQSVQPVKQVLRRLFFLLRGLLRLGGGLLRLGLLCKFKCVGHIPVTSCEG